LNSLSKVLSVKGVFEYEIDEVKCERMRGEINTDEKRSERSEEMYVVATGTT